MKKLSSLALAALAFGAIAAISPAQIRALTMPEMVNETDDCIHGRILSSRVFRLDCEENGPEQYFTALTISGRLLSDGSSSLVEVVFRGGFIDAENGVYNSEAPKADDVKIGNNVVVFYKWNNNLADGCPGNEIYAGHGGLYRAVSGPEADIVLGRGPGYAVMTNTDVTDLTSAVQRIRKVKKQTR